MKTKLCIIVAGMLLATVGTALGQTEFVRMPDLPNNSIYSFGCASGDYDGDGFPDLVVTQWPGYGLSTQFFHNKGNGKFVKKALEIDLAFSEHGQGVSAMGPFYGDVNRDGWLDVWSSF